MLEIDYNIPEIALEKDQEDDAKKNYLKWRFYAILEHQKNQLKTKIRNRKR